jgi:choline dehydrogenase-like flavoprotein
MENTDYDVVIVGAGIAGAIVAKTLVDAGKNVLLLEAGLDEGIALHGKAALAVQASYLSRFYQAGAKAPNSPYPPIRNALSADVLDITTPNNANPNKGYLVQAGPLPFGSDNLIAAGGTTQHWLGTSLRMLPNDFRESEKYKHGVDWPIEYKHLISYYEMAEFEIGVSGTALVDDLPIADDDKPGYYGKDYVFPMKMIPQSYLDKQILKKTHGLQVKMNGKPYTVKCISTPQGRNSEPEEGYQYGGIIWDKAKKELTWQKSPNGYQPVGSLWDRNTGLRCEGNASCVPICPVQAKYNALKTLKKAVVVSQNCTAGHLDIITQAVASQVIVGDDKKITGIRYKKYQTANGLSYCTGIAKGTIYVLAASAIENAKLLLASNAANSSDKVGRNLMDHMCLLTWGLFPEPVYPFRGPGSTTNIANFRDGEFRKDHAPWICPIDNWGWGWPEFSPGTDVSEALAKGIFGKKLREHLENILTRQVLLHFECEQDPEPENRVTIDPKYKDNLDNFRPVIHYNASNYMRKAFEAAKQVSNQIFAANGITDNTVYDNLDPGFLMFNGQPYTYRGAGHIVGTHRMGNSAVNSVVNTDQRTWDHENLFLVGCGNMPTLGTSNPTLTMAALTFKATEAILRQLN